MTDLFELTRFNFNREELTTFIIEAKRHGWPANKSGQENKAEYNKGQFGYIDEWSGYYSGGGQEIVSFRGKPVWRMNYFGHISPEHLEGLDEKSRQVSTRRVFNFLKQVLLRIEPQRPFRGPEGREVIIESFPELVYRGECGCGNHEGNTLEDFCGTEFVLLNDGGSQVIFSGVYHGGLIVPKNP